MNKYKYISELITKDEIKKWEQEDLIWISSGTGTGKTFWSLNVLAKSKLNKRILFLSSRKILKDQVVIDSENNKNVHVMNYQTIQGMNYNERMTLSNKYDIIVADEIQSHIDDASFNSLVDVSLKFIAYFKGLTVCMTATGDDIKDYIEDKYKLKFKEYTIEKNYDHFSKDIRWYSEDKTVISIVDELLKDDVNDVNRVLYFGKVSVGKQLKETYKRDCLFHCSQNKRTMKKHAITAKDFSPRLMEKMKKTSHLEKKILATTKAMDVGFNIKYDPNCKYTIIVDESDISTFTQMIGRLRVDNVSECEIDIFVKDYTFKDNKKFLDSNINMLKPVDLFKESQKDFYKEYLNDRTSDFKNPHFYKVLNEDGINFQYKLNDLVTFATSKRIDYYNELIKEIIYIDKDDFGFDLEEPTIIDCHYRYIISNLLDNKCLTLYNDYEEEYFEGIERSVMEIKLENIVGELTTDKDKKELIDIVNLKDCNNRQVKSISSMNNYFEEFEMSFVIISKRKNIKGKKVTIWDFQKTELE